MLLKSNYELKMSVLNIQMFTRLFKFYSKMRSPLLLLMYCIYLATLKDLF